MDNNSNQTNLSLSSNKFSVYNSINLKRRPDGTPYKSRLEMKQSYLNSRLPYPLSVIWNLDYCWNIVKSHVKNCIFFSVPLTLVFSYTLNPKVRTDGMKSRPLVYYVSLYMIVYTMMSGYFMIDSLAFCDYCKPWSAVYDSENKNETYKQILKSRIKNEQSSFDAVIKKTKEKGLKDDEI